MMVNSGRKLTSKDCYSLLEEKNSKNMVQNLLHMSNGVKVLGFDVHC